jgi:hypothetical protein
MNSTDFRFGFRVVGGRERDRRPIDWQTAFTAHVTNDERAQTDSESYLSAFQFDSTFTQYLQDTGSTRGFSGPTWAAWLWFDIDRQDDELKLAIATALDDTVKLVSSVVTRFSTHPDDLLIFFSGSKGFHVGLPTGLWNPDPSPEFHTTAKAFADALATNAGVVIDAGVYDRVRLFRSPNSRHPKTGLHKRLIGAEELYQITAEGILDIARHPRDEQMPPAPKLSPVAQDDWLAAMQLAGNVSRSRAIVRQSPRLNAATLRFIREGETVGDRHRMLFSAAANLAELNCPADLTHALLTPAAQDSGLTPADIRRQVDCGLSAGGPIHD